MTEENVISVEEAMRIVWDLANQNALTKAYTQDDPDLETERLKQETALTMLRGLMLNVVEPIREAPEGSSFMTLFVAYLFEDKRQFLMYDEGETDLRGVINDVSGSPVSLIAWNKRSGFPTPEDFEKFHRDVAEEFGDIPFVD